MTLGGVSICTTLTVNLNLINIFIKKKIDQIVKTIYGNVRGKKLNNLWLGFFGKVAKM